MGQIDPPLPHNVIPDLAWNRVNLSKYFTPWGSRLSARKTEFKTYWYRYRQGNLTEGLKGCIFWKDSSLDCDDKVDEEEDQIGDTMEISRKRTKLYLS